jgi:uncharacterized protein (TIGR03083 family)
MALPPLERSRAEPALKNATERFVRLLRTVEDPSRNAIGHWDIGQLAAHVSHLFSMYPALARGEGSPIDNHRRMGEHWDRGLEEDRLRNPVALADRIEESTDHFIAAADVNGWDRIVDWHGGIKTPVAGIAGFLVNECEIHGFDVAQAEDRRWTVDPGHARYIIDAHMPVLPYFTRDSTIDGLNAVFQLDVRGGSTTYFIVRDGDLTIDTDRPSRVDCRISADPVEYLLVGYGRKSQWGPLLTGKILAIGRKPWLGLTFAKLFESV